MSWKCKLGFHDWVMVNKNDEYKRWAREKGFVNDKGLVIYELARFRTMGGPILDRICKRCGKKELNQLQSKKERALEKKEEYDSLSGEDKSNHLYHDYFGDLENG